MALTDTRLRNLRATGARQELPDRDGLSLRVSQRGVMTWSVAYRVQGQGVADGARGKRVAGAKRRLLIGEYPTVGLAAAREKALEIKRLARSGVDPAERGTEPRPKTLKVRDLVDRFVEQHLRRNTKVASNVEKLLNLHVLPRWGGRDASKIARSDLVELLEVVRVPRKVRIDGKAGVYEALRGGPGAAAEARKWTIALFQFAADAGLVAQNDLAGLRNRDRQQPRRRVLTLDELRLVWRASANLEEPWRAYFRLLLLTGDRRSEWANAQVTWLQADGARLEIPADHYKTGKPQVVPLSRQAREVLADLGLPEHGSFLLSTTSGMRPISGFSRVKARLDALLAKEATVTAWVVHDLRRSMATHMERIGIEPHIIEVCLGHTLKGIAATYRHYSYLPEKERALQRWADELVPTDASSSPPAAGHESAEG